jgi:hypothetical protein
MRKRQKGLDLEFTVKFLSLCYEGCTEEELDELFN